MKTKYRALPLRHRFSGGANDDLGPQVAKAVRSVILSLRDEYWAALPSAVLAVVTQDSGRAGAIMPAAAGLIFLTAGGVDALRSTGVPRLFRNHMASRLTTSNFLDRAEAKEWRQARGRVLIFCATGLILFALAAMTFAGRWPVAVLGAGLLALVTLRLAGFWPLRHSPGGGWLLRAVLPVEVVVSALRHHPPSERHGLAWTQTGRLFLLRRAAADAAQVEPELARLLAARHALDSLFPRVTYRDGGPLADLHLLWIGGHLVGRVVALSCALAMILSFALPHGALGTWPDLSGLPFLEGLRDEAPKDPPKEEKSPPEDKSQDSGSSGGGGGGSGESSGDGEGAGADGGGQGSAGQGSGGGDTGQSGGSGGQGGAEGGSRQASAEGASGESGSAGADASSSDAGDGSSRKGSSGSGEAGGKGDSSTPEAGDGAQQAPSGGGAGAGAEGGQGASGQAPSAGADATQESDPGGTGNTGSDPSGQSQAQGSADRSTADAPSSVSGDAGADGPAGQSPATAGGGLAQGSDPEAGGEAGTASSKGGAAPGAEGGGGNGASDADPTGMEEGSLGGDQSGTGPAGAGGSTDPAEAAAMTEGAAPETGSTGVVALPSQGQGEAGIPPDGLVSLAAGQAPETEGETASVGSAAQLYAEPGQAPNTIETRLFPDETIPPPPVAPDPPRQMLPAWIRLILEANR